LEAALAKAKGRRVCGVCSESYNLAEVAELGWGRDLPETPRCGRRPGCSYPEALQTRADDQDEERFRQRYSLYEAEEVPAVGALEGVGEVEHLTVTGGYSVMAGPVARVAARLLGLPAEGAAAAEQRAVDKFAGIN